MYKVTYTRNMAGGKRLLCTDLQISETDLKLLFCDKSEYGYIVISAVLTKQYTGLQNLYKIV